MMAKRLGCNQHHKLFNYPSINIGQQLALKNSCMVLRIDNEDRLLAPQVYSFIPSLMGKQKQ